MRLNKITTLLLFSCVLLNLPAQNDARSVYDGNLHYKSGRMGDAVMNYREALEANPSNRKATFNLGDALYKSAIDIRSGKMQAPVNATITPDSIAGMMFDKAAENFAVVANSVSDKDTLHRAWHNIGNCYLQKKDYRNAVEAYKKSLRFDPKDEETRYNLAYALKNLPPEKKGGGGGAQQKQQQQQQKQEQKKQQNEMSKEQAEQLLKALMDAEKRLQDKRKQRPEDAQKDVEKDW
jgi:Ca-activated chloride channel homolog